MSDFSHLLPTANQAVDMAGKSYAFDGDWGRAKISRDEYTKAYETTDDQYAKMLERLVAELKKTS